MFRTKDWRCDSPQRRRPRLHLEELEARITPYVTTGDAWPHPQLVTISFVPDGTTVAYNQNGQAIPSTLFHDFNSLFGSTAAWEKQILLAAQAWAKATNINFAVVSDSGVPLGQYTGVAEQGDPTVGDIRIAGFNDPNGTYLGQAYYPPPGNNYSIAGDLWFNTGAGFHVGTTYDLFTVAAHEIGHALGMSESTSTAAIMAPYYPGTFTDLTTDDAQGIQSIYSAGSPRSFDAYNQNGTHNNSFSNAAGFAVDPVLMTAQLTGLDITTVGQSEYFKFVAPAGSCCTMSLSIQSAGLSLLEPRVWVYNGSQQQIAYRSGVGNYGATLNLTLNNVVAGQTYYIRVNGAESNGLGTGTYDLSLALGTNALPTVTLPNTYTPAGAVQQTTSSNPELGDTYDAAPSDDHGAGHDGSITAQLPGSSGEAVGVLPVSIGHILDDLSDWVTHHAQPAAAGPHTDPTAAANGHATTDAPADADAPLPDAVPSLFPGDRRDG